MKIRALLTPTNYRREYYRKPYRNHKCAWCAGYSSTSYKYLKDDFKNLQKELRRKYPDTRIKVLKIPKQRFDE